MPRGEPRDHEQAEPQVVAERGDVQLGRVGQVVVEPLVLVLGHAEAPVLDLHRQALGHFLRGDLHLGVGRGEGGAVLDQFGDEVDHVGDGLAAERGPGHALDDDPRVVLGLGDGAAQHVHHRDGVAPAPGGQGAAQDDQVLGVAPHPGGEVVDREQFAQQLGFLVLALQRVQHADLAVDQDLGAPGDVEEDLLRPLAALGLVDDRGDGGLPDGGEAVGGLLDLVADPPGGGPGGRGRDRFAGLEPADDLRDLVLGEGQGLGVEVGEPAREGARGAQAADQAPEQDDDDHRGAAVEGGALPGVAQQVGGVAPGGGEAEAGDHREGEERAAEGAGPAGAVARPGGRYAWHLIPCSRAERRLSVCGPTAVAGRRGRRCPEGCRMW